MLSERKKGQKGKDSMHPRKNSLFSKERVCIVSNVHLSGVCSFRNFPITQEFLKERITFPSEPS